MNEMCDLISESNAINVLVRIVTLYCLCFGILNVFLLCHCWYYEVQFSVLQQVTLQEHKRKHGHRDTHIHEPFRLSDCCLLLEIARLPFPISSCFSA